MPLTEDISLSIIIVNWNTHALLCRCLEAIRAAVPPIRHEIIVVDNNSTDHSPEMVAELFPDIRLIRNADNRGFSAASNQGIAASSGPYLMLLNPDTEVHPNAVSKLISCLESVHSAGAAGPKLLNTDGSLQKNGQRFPTFAREFMHIVRLHRLFPKYFETRLEWGRTDFDVRAEVDTISGACMLIPRGIMDAVGGLDDGFFMYYEEVDWCRRARSLGYRVLYCPDAVVTHHSGGGSRQVGLTKMETAYDSQFRYHRKHSGLPAAVSLRILSGFCLLLMRVGKAILGGTR